MLGTILGPYVWFFPILNQLDASRQLRPNMVHCSWELIFNYRVFPLKRRPPPLIILSLSIWTWEGGRSPLGEFYLPGLSGLKIQEPKSIKFDFETLTHYGWLGVFQGCSRFLLAVRLLSIPSATKPPGQAEDRSSSVIGGPEIFRVIRSLRLGSQEKAGWDSSLFFLPKGKTMLKIALRYEKHSSP